jgi:hypothetical protein
MSETKEQEIIEKLICIDGYGDDEVYFIKTNLGYRKFCVTYAEPHEDDDDEEEDDENDVEEGDDEDEYAWLEEGKPWNPNRECKPWEGVQDCDEDEFNKMDAEFGDYDEEDE